MRLKLDIRNIRRSWIKQWRRVRGFDYSDLSFLYIACLVTIAFVYTLFRTSQFYLTRQETHALDAVQQIDAQRDLTAEMERLIAYAQNRTAPQYPATVRQLVETYAAVRRTQRENFNVSSILRRNCEDRPCKDIFNPEFFSLPPERVAKDLNNTRISLRRHHGLLQQLFKETSLYRRALKDTLALSFDLIRAKNRTTLAFDIIAYFSLIILLLVQAIYVFRPAIRRLNASLATRSDFLSRISHEIRNPMNSILGMADILKGTRLNYEQRQYVDNLMRSGHALLDMLNNLIDFSVIEGGRLNLKTNAFDLFRSLERGLNLISVQAHHKNLSVYVRVDPRTPNRLLGDSTRLDQVLINLLNNAAKFTEQGHIQLSVDVENEDEDSVQLRFAVTDSGIGIRPEQLNEIFESFVQGDSSIQRKYGGSGLGLSISREIIRLMGGNLHVESDFGKGSRFFFSLTLGKQKTREGIVAAPLQQLHASQFVFLVAAPETEVYREQFSHLGCVTPVLNSAQQLAHFLQENLLLQIHQLLIDDSVGIISMINCRNVADQYGLGDRSVALIRSNFTKENMDLLKRNGFTRFLIKPMKPWELLTLPAATDEEDETRKTANLAPNRTLVDRLRAKNLRVLLVDDSNDNLFLLKEVINPVADSIHFAENGLDAIHKFRANKYDVVFMDIQMPVMDGYTAIRKMREFEGESGPNVPIYAVTAHAGLVDAQKCREAGFTDRIVKPVVRSDIYESLAKAFALDRIDTENEPNHTMPAKYLAKLLPTYFKTRYEDVEKLYQALSNEDFKALGSLGHKVKGSSASYGFAKTSELSLQLEMAAYKQDIEECRRVVMEMEALVREDEAKFKDSPDLLF